MIAQRGATRNGGGRGQKNDSQETLVPRLQKKPVITPIDAQQEFPSQDTECRNCARLHLTPRRHVYSGWHFSCISISFKADLLLLDVQVN